MDAAGLDAARFDDASVNDEILGHEILGRENLGHEIVGAKERSRALLGAISTRSIPYPSPFPLFSVFSIFTAGGITALTAGAAAIGITDDATYCAACAAVCSGRFGFTAGEAVVFAASAAAISIAGGTKFSTTPISSDGSYSSETTAAFWRKRLLMSAVWREFNRESESCRKLRKVQSR